MKLSPPETRVAVELLARTDALFLPVRRQAARQAVEQARHRFAAGGLPMGLEAGDRSDERARLRTLHGMAARGLVSLVRPKAGRAALVRLTDAADALARRAAFHAGSPETGRLSAYMLVRHEAACDCCHRGLDGRCWVRETALGGCEWGEPGAGEELAAVEELMLPALVRGWAESNTTSLGHAFYAVTAAGRSAAGAEPAAEDADPETPPDPASAALYVALRAAEQDRLETLEPQKASELGGIPIPVAFRNRRPAAALAV